MVVGKALGRLSDRYRALANLRRAVQLIEKSRYFPLVVPEVGTNVAMAIPGAKSVDDVAAVPGRIVVVEGRARAVGCPWFGASSHLARLLLERMKYDPNKLGAINIQFSSSILKAVEHVAQQRSLVISYFEREKEPPEVAKVEGKSLPWGLRQAIENAGGKIPDIVWDGGGVGKEAMVRIFGKNAVDATKIALAVAKLVSKQTS